MTPVFAHLMRCILPALSSAARSTSSPVRACRKIALQIIKLLQFVGQTVLRTLAHSNRVHRHRSPSLLDIHTLTAFCRLMTITYPVPLSSLQVLNRTEQKFVYPVDRRRKRYYYSIKCNDLVHSDVLLQPAFKFDGLVKNGFSHEATRTTKKST